MKLQQVTLLLTAIEICKILQSCYFFAKIEIRQFAIFTGSVPENCLPPPDLYCINISMKLYKHLKLIRSLKPAGGAAGAAQRDVPQPKDTVEI